MRISELVNILKDLKKILLKSNNYAMYNDMLEYMLNPYEIIDLVKYDNIKEYLNSEISKDYVSALKKEIYSCYCNDKSNYKEFIINGQCDIWDNIGRVYIRLSEICKKIEQLKIDIIDDNYYMACQEVKKVLDFCSASFSEVSKYEQVMGIDRYLSDIIA